VNVPPRPGRGAGISWFSPPFPGTRVRRTRGVVRSSSSESVGSNHGPKPLRLAGPNPGLARADSWVVRPLIYERKSRKAEAPGTFSSSVKASSARPTYRMGRPVHGGGAGSMRSPVLVAATRPRTLGGGRAPRRAPVARTAQGATSAWSGGTQATLGGSPTATRLCSGRRGCDGGSGTITTKVRDGEEDAGGMTGRAGAHRRRFRRVAAVSRARMIACWQRARGSALVTTL